jgi:CRP/FNR family cyclic AMP-dependent transcriptional regulator
MSPRTAARGLVVTRLRRLAFFREFSPEELRRLLPVGSLRACRDGELLATEGTRKQRRVLYVILQGELQYVKRVRGERANVVLTLQPGEVGGFLTFFNDDPSPVTVCSVGRSQVFEVGRREFEQLLEEHPPLAVKVLRILLQENSARLKVLLGRVASTAAWALDLEQHLHALPLLPE